MPILLNDEYLEQAGITLRELAKKSETPYSTLIKYFHLIDTRGLTTPLLHNARRIAAALNLPLDDVRFLGE